MPRRKRCSRKVRWPETNGAPVCPHCGGLKAYDCRRPNGAPRFRCRACKKDFSITSGTLFASHKLPLRGYLAAIAVFCNEVKGKAALALSRDLGLSYKAAFVLCHKLREAMAEEMKGRVSAATARSPRSMAVISAATSSLPISAKIASIAVLPKTKTASASCRHRARAQWPFAPGRVPPRRPCPRLHSVARRKGTVVNADEAASWDSLNSHFEMKRINHQEAYSEDGACTNWAEEYFSRLRRAEIGVITTSQATICFVMRRKVLGARIIAACRMAIRPSVSLVRPCGKRAAQISSDIGSGTLWLSG